MMVCAAKLVFFLEKSMKKSDFSLRSFSVGNFRRSREAVKGAGFGLPPQGVRASLPFESADEMIHIFLDVVYDRLK